MRRKTSEFKAMAREALRGKYALFIGVNMLISMIMGMGSSLSISLFGGDTIFSTVMGQLFSFILSLILSVFTAGVYYIYLNAARGRQTGYGDMFYLFRKHPDRVIVVSLLLSGVEYLCTLPALIFVYRYVNLNTSDLMLLMRQSVIMAGLTMAGTAISAILTLPFTLSYYLLIDSEEMEAGEALRTSMRLMRGNYVRYFGMLLSFLGLYFLGICSFYIGLLWVQPYMEMTSAEFYRELCGDLDAVQPEKPSEDTNTLPVAVLPEEIQTAPDDDYNAEA